MSDFTTTAGIAGTAIALANVVVWAFGLDWTPRVKAGVGAISALVVFVLGLVLWPGAWPDGPMAFTTLFQALLVVLAAAGAPVFRDVIRGEEMDGMDAMDGAMDEHGRRSGTTGTRTRGRRWEGWNL